MKFPELVSNKVLNLKDSLSVLYHLFILALHPMWNIACFTQECSKTVVQEIDKVIELDEILFKFKCLKLFQELMKLVVSRSSRRQT